MSPLEMRPQHVVYEVAGVEVLVSLADAEAEAEAEAEPDPEPEPVPTFDIVN